MEAYVSLFGLNDQNIALIEQECNVTVALRRNHLVITGESTDIDIAHLAILHLLNLIKRNETVDRIRIRYTVSMLKEGKKDLIEENLRHVIAVTHRGKEITCKTVGQRLYVDTIRNHMLTFAVGLRHSLILCALNSDLIDMKSGHPDADAFVIPCAVK